MNYRQWKKNYKKRNGHNPPLEADKRRQAKIFKKAMKNTSVTINDITAAVQNIGNTITRAIAGIYRGLSNGFRVAADAAQSVAERIERGNERRQ